MTSLGACWNDQRWSWSKYRVHGKYQCHDFCIWMCSWCNLPWAPVQAIHIFYLNSILLKSVIWYVSLQGWGVAVIVGIPNKDDAFKTHPMNILNERTIKGTFFGNYKPRSDLPSVVEKYMNKVSWITYWKMECMD